MTLVFVLDAEIVDKLVAVAVVVDGGDGEGGEDVAVEVVAVVAFDDTVTIADWMCDAENASAFDYA